MRDQPNPIIGDEEMIWKEMPAAAADGGYDNDMSGNPLKEGILADGGWQNRKVRDEFVGSTNRQTFSMDPYEPWWHESADKIAEEREIEGDAEIESVMPPTDSDSPTIEASLVDGIPGWHTATTALANLSLSELSPPLMVDGEPYTQEMGRELIGEYMRDDHPPKTFMISHPDELYLNAMKEIIETGRPGPDLAELRNRMADERNSAHAERHAIHDSEVRVPAGEERGKFHDDHEALSRALYATQAHTYGLPYLSADQGNQAGIRETHGNYSAGDIAIPIATSHPELGEILQRVADLNSLDPLADWLAQHPELTEDQEGALQWMAEKRIMESKVALVQSPPTVDPSGFKTQPGTKMDDILTRDYMPGGRTPPGQPPMPPGTPKPTAPQTPKPGVKPGLGPAGGFVTGLDVVNQIGNQQGWWNNTKGQPVPKDWGKAWDIRAPKDMWQDSTSKWVFDNVIDPGAGAVGNELQKGMPLPGLPINPGMIPGGLDTAKDIVTKPFELGADAVKNLIPGGPKTEPEKPQTDVESPNLSDLAPAGAAAALGLGALGLGLGGNPAKNPTPVADPEGTFGGGARTQTDTQEQKPRGRRPFNLPNLPQSIPYQMNSKPPMEYMTHVAALEEIRDRMTKRSEREDAKEHPSSHSEIPANDISNPDAIDPKQKKDGDMSDWQKDFSVNDIGGARQDPGAVVVTVQSDRPEDFDIKEIADVLGVEKESESVKLVTDFWDHFMDHINKPEKERDSKDPLLSLLGELLGNERKDGSPK
jgi:hypothetical protein